MVNELAYYIRLSLADEETGKVKDESESISNQRALILKYISDHPEFDGWKVHEFVDDGYSGTNGDRPDFQRMIERVHGGSIQCIIVKDLCGNQAISETDYSGGEKVQPQQSRRPGVQV